MTQQEYDRKYSRIDAAFRWTLGILVIAWLCVIAVLVSGCSQPQTLTHADVARLADSVASYRVHSYCQMKQYATIRDVDMMLAERSAITRTDIDELKAQIKSTSDLTLQMSEVLDILWKRAERK